jgi:hypothetical protein
MITALGEHAPGFQRLIGLVVVKARRNAIEMPKTEEGRQDGNEEQRKRNKPAPCHQT